MIEIQKVTIEDTEELLKIYGPYVSETAISFEYNIPSKAEFAGRIQEISKKYPYIKAVDNKEILGYAYAGSFKARRAYDRSVETTIYVRQDSKGAGIGRLLYNSLENSLKNMGILNMNACIASPQKEDEYLTDASRYFHEKMGFNLVGRFHKCGYKFGRWYDMIWMEKLIGEHSDCLKEIKFGEWNIKE